jgi:hypothetical protein
MTSVFTAVMRELRAHIKTMRMALSGQRGIYAQGYFAALDDMDKWLAVRIEQMRREKIRERAKGREPE